MTALAARTWQLGHDELTLELWPDVFVPTSTSEVLVEVLDIVPGDIVIDLGCGSGFLSIAAAKRGASKVYAVDVMPRAVELTRRNAKRNGVAACIDVVSGSLFEPLGPVQADLVIDDVSAIAEETARITPWYPPSIPTGGPDGAEPTVTMLRTVHRHLRPNGRLIFPVLSLANEQRILEAAEQAFTNLRLRAQKLFPIPRVLQEALERVKQRLSASAMRLIQRGSRQCWQLRIFEARAHTTDSAESNRITEPIN